MDWMLYLRPFLMSFSVAVCLLFPLRGILAHFEKTGSMIALFVRRFGGMAIILAFLFALFLESRLVVTPALSGMIVGSVAVLFFGVWDDVTKLGWKIQLLFQMTLGVALFAFGMRIFSLPVPFVGQVFVDTLPGGVALGCVVLVLWTVFVMNVMNWADGIDGLLPSISLLSFSAIFFVSLSPQVNQPPIGILSMALFGAFLGFLLFNMPPARIFAGTSGSFFAGFALSSLSVLSGTKIATALLVLSLPILDALWVFSERLRSGTSPFRGDDARHLHYRLRQIGWSDRRIVLCYILCTGTVGVIALSTDALGKTLSFLFVGVLVVSFLSWVRKKSASLRVSLVSPQKI